jgi:hypothetical protein
VLRTIFLGLVALYFGMSSGSSSEGVGNTLNGVFMKLFLRVFAGVFAGVVSAAPTADFLFLGDVLVASS